MSRTAAGGGPDPRGSGSPAAAISPFPVLVAIVALLVGLLLAVVITATSSGSGTSRPTHKPIAMLAASGGTVVFRPVLCFAPPYDATASPGSGGTLPTCGAPYQLKAWAINWPQPITDIRRIRVRPIPALAGLPKQHQ